MLLSWERVDAFEALRRAGARGGEWWCVLFERYAVQATRRYAVSSPLEGCRTCEVCATPTFEACEEEWGAV